VSISFPIKYAMTTNTEDTDFQLALKVQEEEDAHTASVFACETTVEEKNQEDILRGIIETNTLETSLYCTGRMSHEKVNFIHIPKNGGTTMKKICTHSHGTIGFYEHVADVTTISNQLIVIRNPIERFISAVKYEKKYGMAYFIRGVVFHDYEKDTPDNWVKAWENKDGKYEDEHGRLLNIMENRSKKHKIGERVLPWKYHYTPQSEWICGSNVKYVVLFDYFEHEMKQILHTLGVEYNLEDDHFPHFNDSTKETFTLSPQSIAFLKTQYEHDFHYYDEIKKRRMKMFEEELVYNHRA
jgi:hypothetical protein